MWWNYYTEFSRRVADQFTEFLTPPPGRKSTSQQSALKGAGKSSSPQLDAMIQQISEDLARMSENERENVKAEMAYHAREWCLKDISHDLRTPLNAIIGFTQLMESGVFGSVSNPQYLEYLRHIRESGYELLGKVEDLVDTVATDHAKEHAPLIQKEPFRMKEAVA